METSENPPVFPYEIVCEDFAERWVTIDDLKANAATYATLFEICRHLEAPTPFVDAAVIMKLIAPLGLDAAASAHLADEATLIAGWYLGPDHRRFIQTDLASARKVLRRAARAARELRDALSEIPPKIAATMSFVRKAEPDAMDPGHMFEEANLSRTLYDLALVADRIVAETAPVKTGRKTPFVRDTAVRLAMEAVERAGAGRVEMSRGTNARPEPHFAGASGEFVRDLFALFGGARSEEFLVGVAERVRRRVQPT